MHIGAFDDEPQTVVSVNKGRHAWQCVFPALFTFFDLKGGSPSASQKAKITRKSIPVRCAAVLTEQKCGQTMKRPQRILAVLSRTLKKYGRISARQNRVCPCQLILALMDEYIAQNGYENDITESRLHHEIYLSDARKVAPEKWKTVIRHPIKGSRQKNI